MVHLFAVSQRVAGKDACERRRPRLVRFDERDVGGLFKVSGARRRKRWAGFRPDAPESLGDTVCFIKIPQSIFWGAHRLLCTSAREGHET